jgi:redox-sensitive bicupin YhaK (pirin superfamily)
MIKIQKYAELGTFKNDWLEAHYHFSFSNYHNPERMGFGKLRVINDDIVKAGGGFATHPHKDMEIITYVRQGVITHKDSKGNLGRTESGDVQVMSAGSGIRHSEHNNENIDANLYQIWIEPKELSVQPRWAEAQFPKELVSDKLRLLVSGDKNDKNALFIHQDAKIYGGRLNQGLVINHSIRENAYILVSDGEVEIEGQKMLKGDGAEITDLQNIKISAINAAEILIIEIAK